MFDKNYFLNQLRNGVSMDSMGQALADAMNEAQDAYIAEQEVAKAKQAEADLIAAKRALAIDMVEIIQEYGELVAPDAEDVFSNVSEDDIDAMVESLDQMFNMMSSLMQLKRNLEKAAAAPTLAPGKLHRVAPKSDDEVLANFIKSLV